ncbi:MAG: hypothetical protein ABSE51_04675 [Terracidiphilus sp.]|jgi:hypothetical protein
MKDWMRMGLEMALGIAVLAQAAAPAACAQAPGLSGAANASTLTALSSPKLIIALVQIPVEGEIVREIDDPHTRDRWLLMRDSQHPGGPGRMVLVAARRDEPGRASANAAAEKDEARFNPIIRAGDRLIVEEHTEVADAVLEARALNPAAQGSAFDARLTIGGRVVRAVALAPGRATLQPQTAVRP